VFLVSLDTDAIKEFIYASRKLRQIRAGSYLLTRLDAALRQMAEDHGLATIYLAGGSGLLRGEDEAQVDRFMREARRFIARETDGQASVTMVKEQATPAECSGAGFRQVFDRLKEKLVLAKAQRQAPPRADLAFPFLESCQWCGEPASQMVRDPEGAHLPVCWLCACKDQLRAEMAEKDREFLTEAEMPKAEFPRDFQDLVGKGEAGADLGFLYADGNNMGQLLLSLQTQEAFTQFSTTLEQAMRKAVCQAAEEVFPNYSGSHAPFVPLMCGGDDLILVAAATQIFPLTMAIMRAFHDETKTGLGRDAGLTLSAGVVIAPPSYPIATVHEMAEQLVASAKKRTFQVTQGQDTPGFGGCLDFHLLYTGSAHSIADFRRQACTLRSEDGRTVLARLVERPYTLAEFETAWRLAGGLAVLPARRRHELATALTVSREEAMATFMKQAARLKEDEKRRLLEIFEGTGGRCPPHRRPWRDPGGQAPWTTPLFDLLELAELAAPAAPAAPPDR
jgi:hypothetical protein